MWPSEIQNVFDITGAIQNDTTAFSLASTPTRKNSRMSATCERHGLDLMDFVNALKLYGVTFTTRCTLSVWSRVRLQLKSVQDDDVTLPLQTVLTEGSDEGNPFGTHNFVLVHDADELYHGSIKGRLLSQPFVFDLT